MRRNGANRTAGLTRVELTFLLIALAIAAMSALHFLTTQSIDQDRSPSAHEPEFTLPDASVEVPAILGQDRRTVRATLGAADSPTPDTDAFQAGAHLDVHYSGDRADSIVVQWPRAALHERAMRRWLMLPGDGPIDLHGQHYRVTLFVGDDDRLAVEPETGVPATPRTATHHRAAVAGGGTGVTEAQPGLMPTSHAAGLLKDFPRIPESVRQSCAARGDRHRPSITCPGFDAHIAYELDAANHPISLAILDAAAPHTEDECRALLEQSLPTLTAGKKVDTQYNHTGFYASPALLAAYTWTPVVGFHATTSCSIVACLPGTGSARTICTP